MKKKEYFLLYLLCATLLSILTLIIREPGYMDAEYYYAGGIQIISGRAGIEPFIWNYLNQPQMVLSPSFTYWMPFTSMLAAAGMGILGSTGFFAARLGFVLLAGSIPVISAWFANTLFPSRGSGWLAGVAAIFSVYYLPYLTTTDSFTPYIVLGGLFIFTAYKIWQNREQNQGGRWWILLLGILTGLLHLTRADGIIWLVFGTGILFFSSYKDLKNTTVIKKLILALLIYLSGYLFVMSGWFFRNILEYDALIPPGGSKMLWATSYDDIFYYFTGTITPERFLSIGLGKIILDRLAAFWTNIKSLLAVNGSLVLAPIIGMGLWKTRKHFISCLTIGITVTILLVMSFAFPYAGSRGGFFHSNSAIQAVFWGLVPVGLNGFIEIGIRFRKWIYSRSWKMFGIALIGILTILSVFILFKKLENSSNGLKWNETLEVYSKIDQEMVEKTGDVDSIVMVNDPPGFYLATNRMSIVNPGDGVDALIAAADQYDARFTVIDQNNVKLIDEMYANGLLNGHFRLISKFGSTEIYEILR